MAIAKVLVANRGEIARRVFRTCRSMGIATVAVFAPPDAAEPHAREADEAIALSGSDPTSCYLDMGQIISAAVEQGADAIHPGYGFLSENAAFALAVTAAGLTWIGPPPGAIEVMGSKIASKRLMERSGVPIIPSRVTEEGPADELVRSLGLPVLVKASAGGGGKGMRVVETIDDLGEAVESARREAASAFGDDTVFFEKYLASPRHVEIQVFADTHGNIVSLYERECSIQRRHQKIIEESPSIAVDGEMRERLGAAAIAAARATRYVGAGTVEFLLEEGQFYFLEMNTRLQVEHPVTEMVTGLDLVRLQIEVAAGQALPDEALSPVMTGHAIEARLYAEDPAREFLPVTGPVFDFRFGDLPGLRVDSGVEAGSRVSIDFDPMLAKVIAHGETRGEAAMVLASALRSAAIHSGTTNRALLIRILESDEFLEGATDTRFLERNDPAAMSQPLLDADQELAAAIAVSLADSVWRRDNAPVQRALPSGWRNSPSAAQVTKLSGPRGEHVIEYSIGGTSWFVRRVDELAVIAATPGHAELEIGGVRHVFDIARHGERRFCDSPHGPIEFVVLPRFPRVEKEGPAGSLRASMPGKVLRVDVGVGDVVEVGRPLLVLEAMKMEHTLRAPHAGTVTDVMCDAGDQVEGQAVLVVIQPTLREEENEARQPKVDGSHAVNL